MKTVYRYVLMEIMPSFLLCLLMLTSLFMINKIFLLMELILKKDIPLGDTLQLYVSLIPAVISITVPMAMMVGTLVAFGRLSSDMEVTAFKSSGVHLFRLIAPALLFGFLMTSLMLYFNARLLPASNYAFKQIHFKILRDKADIAIHERIFIDQFAGYQFKIDQIDSEGLFQGVMMLFHWSPNSTDQVALSKTGSMVSDQKNMQLFFHMNDGEITWGNSSYRTYNRLYFKRFITRLNLENQLSRMTDVKKDFEEMSLSELSREIASTSNHDRKISLRNEYQKRLSLPFACLALTWFCAPLGLWARSKGFISFVLGVVIIFLYYLMFTVGQILSERGTVSPLLGLWWANAILAAIGFLVYYVVVSEHSAFRRGRTSPRPSRLRTHS